MKRTLTLLAAFAATTLLCLWLWWRDGHEIVLTDAPVGRLDCVSYTPSREQPLLPSSIITHEQIQRDLRLLAGRFRCVRIYSVSNGLDQVPAIARQLGLRVLLGLWIDADGVHNQKEIRLGLAVSQRDKDVIEGIIVGNEVLLRRELTADKLAGLIRQVNAATDLPVTYADVWDFWKKNPELAADVDFVTIHLLPYWDDKPTGIDAALAHTAQVYGEARSTFPGKRVFIGETGWPSQGRQRMDAAPGRVAQARFVREFTHWAQAQGISYNLIEAFDQPWKRVQEGTVGGYWGMYDKGGQPKFPLQGALSEDPQWQQGLWGALIGAIAMIGLGLCAVRWMGRTNALLLALAGATWGSVAVMQWRYLATTNRNLTEWLASAILVLTGWFLYFGLVLGFSARRDTVTREPSSIVETLGSFNRRQTPLLTAPAGRSRLLGVLRFLLLLGFAYVSLGLAADARYRGFPTCLYALPIMTLALQALLDRGTHSLRLRDMPEETALASLIGVCAVIIALTEGRLNLPALALSALGLILAASLLGPGYSRARQHQNREQHADNG